MREGCTPKPCVTHVAHSQPVTSPGAICHPMGAHPSQMWPEHLHKQNPTLGAIHTPPALAEPAQVLGAKEDHAMPSESSLYNPPYLQIF
ncbi:hypothetical protein AMECASPLE_021021 [Ameca splendens]|uniref:Uncharacterized protein n=1 Tax=Ameca splendens TaxID=208324 RepID=A0ABV0YQS4_9TELE